MLDKIARHLWFLCISQNNQVSAFHIAGVDNKKADKLSRSKNNDIEWSLDKNIFQKLVEIYPRMSVDSFASKLNARLDKHV